MKPVDDKESTVNEKTELHTQNIDTIKYVERKLMEKGVQRMDRHPADGIGITKPPPKSGHGGKFTWEGPRNWVENELSPTPPALDERDPNHVDEEDSQDAAELVVGEVEVAKAVEERKGVARFELDPHSKACRLTDD